MRRLIFVIVVLLIPSISSSSSFGLTSEKGILGKKYNGTTEKDRGLKVYEFTINKTDVIRIRTFSKDGNLTTPLLSVFRQRSSILSLETPINVINHVYNTTARTICPFYQLEPHPDTVLVTVELSSFSPVSYEFTADIVKDFRLELDKPINTSATVSEPVYYQFEFPDRVDSITVSINSDDDICMSLVVKNVECPVYDQERSVHSYGFHQSITKAGAITLLRSKYDNIFVIVSIFPHDEKCTEQAPEFHPYPVIADPRLKNFTITVQSALSYDGYNWAMGGTLAVSFIVLVVFLILLCAISNFDLRFMEKELTAIQKKLELNRIERSATDSRINYQIGHDEDLDELPLIHEEEQENDGLIIDEDRNNELDQRDRSHSRQTLHHPIHMEIPRHKKPTFYFRTLFATGSFYLLPAVQFLLSWQDKVRISGDTDQCWYNFRCARPLWFFFAVNNILSNIGYIVFGSLLLLKIKLRERNHRSLCKDFRRINYNHAYGIPRRNDLMNSIALSIILEGILSASYHVCPSSRNFQFDVTFMYVMGILGILKLYQLRHDHRTAHAHAAFIFIAILIVLAMIGVYINSKIFMMLGAVVYILVMFVACVEFYYQDRDMSASEKYMLRMPCTILKSILPIFRSFAWDTMHFCLPCIVSSDDTLNKGISKIRSRFIILYITFSGIFLYFAFTIFIEDVLSNLLFLILVNFILYFLHYLTCKIVYQEIKLSYNPFRCKLPVMATFYSLSALFAWAIALVFFILLKVSKWEETPAISRTMNQDCHFGFYDNHDIWHFASSIALFFTFLAIECLDDGLRTKRRDQINIF